MGLLTDLLSRIDAMKRQGYGLLSNPGDTLNQYGAQIGEDAAKLGSAYDASQSVMPGVAAQGNQQMMQGAMPFALVTLYHGSPHLFDKFDMSKIGTGEGGQAFGHGLYLAENPEVATAYQKNLAPGEGLGNLYKVDIPDEAVSRMLDLDRPLIEQPQALHRLKAANLLGDERQFDDWRAFVGPGGVLVNPEDAAQRVYIAAEQSMGGPAAASAAFNAAGIPGLRYLDQGSRAAGGTRNMVLFDDSLARILERNGIPMGQ